MADTYFDLICGYSVFATFISFFIIITLLKQKKISKDLEEIKSKLGK